MINLKSLLASLMISAAALTLCSCFLVSWTGLTDGEEEETPEPKEQPKVNNGYAPPSAANGYRANNGPSFNNGNNTGYKAKTNPGQANPTPGYTPNFGEGKSGPGEPAAKEIPYTSTNAEADALRTQCLQALQIGDGVIVNAKLFAMKEQGPAAYPALFDCIRRIDRGQTDVDSARIRRRLLGIDPKNELILGELYNFIAATESGDLPTLVVDDFLKHLSVDPTRNFTQRVDLVFRLSGPFASNSEVMKSMTEVVVKGGVQYQIAWVNHLIDLEGANPEVIGYAIESLKNLNDQKIIDRLKVIERDPSNLILQLAARVVLLRTLKHKTGYLVEEVQRMTPADRAGIQKGDMILSIKGMRADQYGWYLRAKSAIALGEKAEAVVDRGGRILHLSLGVGVGGFGFSGTMLIKQ